MKWSRLAYGFLHPDVRHKRVSENRTDLHPDFSILLYKVVEGKKILGFILEIFFSAQPHLLQPLRDLELDLELGVDLDQDNDLALEDRMGLQITFLLPHVIT